MWFRNRVWWRLNKHLARYAQAAGLPPRSTNEMVNPAEYGGDGCTFAQYCDIYNTRGVKECALLILIDAAAVWSNLNAKNLDVDERRRNYLYSSICEEAAIYYASSVLGMENAEKVVGAEIEGRQNR